MIFTIANTIASTGLLNYEMHLFLAYALANIVLTTREIASSYQPIEKSRCKILTDQNLIW